MFGIGFSELLIIGVILIVAVGPDKMPGLLKALVRGYREFRKATRELRASTGIDEILEDEDLKSLRQPLYVPPAAKKAAVAAPKPASKARALTDEERAAEVPSEGVDVAEASAAERAPDPDAEKRRAAKMAVLTREQEIVAAKQALAEKSAARPEESEESVEERALREKVEALQRERIDEKIAGTLEGDQAEHDRIVREKLAAAGIEDLEPRVEEATPQVEETDEQRARRAAKRRAAGEPDETPEEEARRAAKIAALRKPPETEEERERREAKIAAARAPEARKAAPKKTLTAEDIGLEPRAKLASRAEDE